MDPYNIHLIAAARPNFMKIAPLYHALKAAPGIKLEIVHTGQHYDANMSDDFFVDLKLPKPSIHLGIGGGTHAEQTGKVMIAYEKILMQERPDMVIVVGDVNATAACTMAAIKVNYEPPVNNRLPSGNGTINRPVVAHLEAGLRSFDRSMPEEINRIVTDSLADILWTPSVDGDDNLIKEGVAPGKISRVGNIMIDSLEMMRPVIEKHNYYEELGLVNGGYGVVTLHRPANVDDEKSLKKICELLWQTSQRIPLICPLHPRTSKNLEKFNLLDELARNDNLIMTKPLNYIKFMSLVFNCRLVITDSGGVQEETTYLNIPCLTLRPNTERPITITEGTNQLCSFDTVLDLINRTLEQTAGLSRCPDLWDGKTADRIVCSIRNISNSRNSK